MSEKNEITFTCNLMGGLGNQMFRLHTHMLNQKDTGLNCVFYPYSETNLQGNNTNFYINNIFSKINFNNKRPDAHVIFEPSFSFNKIDLPKDKNILFSGYLQSHKNFYGYDKEIQKLFEPPKEFIQKIKKIHPNIFKKDSVSIHIRRGDYLNFPNHHPTISIDYIKSALSLFKETKDFYVFSDDEKWCKDNINFIEYTFIKNDFDYEDLWTMSLCGNNIISNSTFSWWAAFLNKNKKKKITIPKIWFGVENKHIITDDLYCESWIKI